MVQQELPFENYEENCFFECQCLFLKANSSTWILSYRQRLSIDGSKYFLASIEPCDFGLFVILMIKQFALFIYCRKTFRLCNSHRRNVNWTLKIVQT